MRMCEMRATEWLVQEPDVAKDYRPIFKGADNGSLEEIVL